MKKYCLLILWLGLGISAKAQESYSKMTKEALESMWKAKDSIGYRKSLNLYEKAFKRYSDSIDNLGLYKASVLAGELKEYDIAFKYLVRLSETETDEASYPGWVNYFAGKYSESEYKNLINDPRWMILKKKALSKRNTFYQKLQESESEFFKIKNLPFNNEQISEILYKQLRNHNPYITKKQQDYSISFTINDSTQTSYFIHLPENYNPEKEYPMLIFLHGAVRNNSLADYQTKDNNLGGWNRYYTKYADQNEVILVFPKGSRQYNWMTPDDGFFMIPEMIKQIKEAININDNKIFISGHSNGATGSFSYLMKQPTFFAGFYGFNTYPKVFTGGTFVENIRNRSFINFSTDQDYYYPPNANDSLSKLMSSINANYKDYRYNGFPHWFPQFDASEPAYEILFDDLIKRERKSYPNQISWELDDEKYGTIDWLSHIKLDTLDQKVTWHKTLNFKIDKWLSIKDKDSLVTENVDKSAFDFPKKSGKIKAEYDNNVFKIKTSCIESFKINISPEMVSLKKKIKVYVNGKLYFNKKVDYNKEYMLKSFTQHKDRKQLWVNYIEVNYKNHKKHEQSRLSQR